mgnify:CR=1 FL=1
MLDDGPGGEPIAAGFGHLPSVPRLELSGRQELAVLAQALFALGYADHMAGHITIRQDDHTLLCNPWGLQWDQITATDVIRIDLQGNRIEGSWPVPPGIPLHLALHAAREHVRFAVHNHTHWSGLWAAAHTVPPVIDQTAGLTDAEVTLVDEFDGAVDEMTFAEAAIARMGSADIALLANHGIFVLGDSAAQTYLRCYAFEWRCRRAAEVAAVGSGVPLRPEVHAALAKVVESQGFPGYWDAAVRTAVLARPRVLF